MNGISEVLEKKNFCIGVLGCFCVFFGYFIAIAVFLGLLLYDLKKSESLNKYLSVLASVSYLLVLLPYLSYTYIEGNETWELQLKLYIASLSLFHLGEYIVQSYFHNEDTTFSSKK